MYKEFYGRGGKIKYFPEEKTLILAPNLKQKNDFLKLKSKLDTLLQVDGTKRIGNSISLKISDNFNASVEELLKSIGLKGGLEFDDAASMVDDAKSQEIKDEENDAPKPEEMMAGPQPPQPGQPPMPESFSPKVYNFLFEELFDFSKKKEQKARRKSKRYGKYWKSIESITGKNRNAINPEDILAVRKKFAKKIKSIERDTVLNSLDKAASYFFSLLKRTRGENEALDFDKKYSEIDSLAPHDYEIDPAEQSAILQNQNVPPDADFDEINYSDIDIEDI